MRTDVKEVAPTIINALRGDGPGPPILARTIATAAERWHQTGGTDVSVLSRGRELREAQRLAAANEAFDDLSLSFLAASAAAQQTRVARTIGLLALIILALAGLTWYALRQEQLATKQRDLAESRAAAADARRTVTQELRRSLVDAIRAYHITPSLDAQTALLEGLTQGRTIRRFYLCGPGEKAIGVAFSHSEPLRLAFACSGPPTRLFLVDIDKNDVPPVVRTLDGIARGMTFVDRDTLAFAGMRDLRVLSAGRLQAYQGHAQTIEHVAASPDGRRIVSVDGIGEVRLWTRVQDNATWSSSILRQATHKYSRAIAWLDDGQIAIEDASENGFDIIRLDGSRVTESHLAGELIRVLERDCMKAFPPSVRYFTHAWTMKHSRAAYTTEENNIIIEDLSQYGCQSPLQLVGHTHNVLVLAFDDAGRWLASAGAVENADDVHGVILWDLAQVHPLARPLEGIASQNIGYNPKLSLSWSGSSWAFANSRGDLIWEGLPLALPPDIEPSSLAAIALTPDGHELAILSQGSLVRGIRTGASIQWTAPESVAELTMQGAARLWYAAASLYSVSSHRLVIRWSPGPPRIVLPALDLKGSTGCYDTYTTGNTLAFGSENQGTYTIAVANLANGASRSMQLPGDAGLCASAVYSEATGTAIRVSAEYQPMYIMRPGHATAEPWENPVRAKSGLKTMLTHSLISADGNRLVSISNGNAFVLFDVPSRRLLGAVPEEQLVTIALSADGSSLLTATPSRTLRWDLRDEHWVETATALVGQRW